MKDSEGRFGGPVPTGFQFCANAECDLIPVEALCPFETVLAESIGSPFRLKLPEALHQAFRLTGIEIANGIPAYFRQRGAIAGEDWSATGHGFDQGKTKARVFR